MNPLTFAAGMALGAVVAGPVATLLGCWAERLAWQKREINLLVDMLEGPDGGPLEEEQPAVTIEPQVLAPGRGRKTH